MSVFDQELVLPGVITDIIGDYSSEYDTSKFGTTDSVAIIGTAFTGPVGKPTKIYSPEHAKYIFGASYDFKTKREATLVAEIQDAWDRGCRTIYAIRISGKNIFKDFQLATDTKCKLRVSGVFPSNDNKDVFFEYSPEDIIAGTKATINIYKPAHRATIEEKMMGRVSKNESVLKSSVKINDNWNVTKTTRLLDFIKLFNEYRYNNVIRLSIVDSNGNDMSETPEGQSATVGDILPGLYLIGRNTNGSTVTPSTKLISKLIPKAEKEKIYKTFSNDIFKILQYNSDVNKDLPIYDTSFTHFGGLLGSVVSMTKMFDFLEVPGKIDSIWLKDDIDYEEVVLDNFETYKRLGSGFANTCKIVETSENSKIFKVVEVTDTLDPNIIYPINDGIYSMLENLKADYRVLTGKFADVEITESLPKKDKFLISTPLTSGVFKKNENSVIEAKAKIDKNDLKAPINYTFELEEIPEDSNLYDKEKMMAKLYLENGQTQFKSYTLPLDSALETAFIASVEDEYILIDIKGEIFVYGKKNAKLEPLANLSEVLKEETELFSTITESGGKMRVTVKTSNLNTTSLIELLVKLNENEQLSKLFEFSLAGTILGEDRYDYVRDSITLTNNVTAVTQFIDRGVVRYDTSLYIPYKTTDNFLRQLAQHSIYASLKTAPTHGIIGCNKLATNTIENISKRVDKLISSEYNLYAKKPNGNDMLDRNNMPYPIGRAVSCTFFQHNVETGDNYTYLTTGASAYAGMVSALPINQSSTAQPINLKSTSYELTNFQLARLTQAGYVTVKDSYTKGYVITDGVTMAPATSPFRRLSVTRIINAIDTAIRAEAEPFIGKQNHLANRNSLQTAIKSKLDKMLENLIERYDFKLVVDKAAERMGIIEIQYNIVPVYEIREVRNRVTVSDNQ